MSSSTVSTERDTAPRWQRWLSGSVFLYPLLMHFLIVNDRLAAALVGLAVMSLIAATLALQHAHGRLQALLYSVIAVVAFVGLGSGHALALYLLPVVFNLMLAFVFGRTLRPGAVPLIERFMRIHHGPAMPPAAAVYARQLTYLWTGLLLASALVAMMLALWAPIATWSLFANVLNYALVVAMFIGQFLYGYARHRLVLPMQIVPGIMRAARLAARSTSIGR